MTRKQIEDLLLNLPLKEVVKEITKSCWCEVSVQNNLLIVADYDMQRLEVFRLEYFKSSPNRECAEYFAAIE